MKRRALFVGVDEYDDPQIRNLRFSRIDAHSLNDLFADVGYDVKYLPNPTKAEVLAAVRERTAGLAAGDSFFFYFAGHGFTQGGRDLLFCRDDVYEDLRFDDAGLKFEKLRQRTETGSGYDRVFVLDACRSDFLTGTRGAATYARDLAPAKNLVKDVTPKTGSLAVLRSCSPYQYALEIESRQHGLFTCALIDVMRTARREGTRLAFDESFGDAVAKTMTSIARNAHLTAEQTPDFAKSAGCVALVLIEGIETQPPLSDADAAPVYVACPECGKYNLPTDTFRCKVCGRDHLCLEHRSFRKFCCARCALDKFMNEAKELLEAPFSKFFEDNSSELMEGVASGFDKGVVDVVRTEILSWCKGDYETLTKLECGIDSAMRRFWLENFNKSVRAFIKDRINPWFWAEIRGRTCGCEEFMPLDKRISEGFAACEIGRTNRHFGNGPIVDSEAGGTDCCISKVGCGGEHEEMCKKIVRSTLQELKGAVFNILASNVAGIPLIVSIADVGPISVALRGVEWAKFACYQRVGDYVLPHWVRASIQNGQVNGILQSIRAQMDPLIISAIRMPSLANDGLCKILASQYWHAIEDSIAHKTSHCRETSV